MIRLFDHFKFYFRGLSLITAGSKNGTALRETERTVGVEPRNTVGTNLHSYSLEILRKCLVYKANGIPCFLSFTQEF